MEILCGVLLVLNLFTYNGGYNDGFISGKRYTEINIGKSMDKAYDKGYNQGIQDSAKKVIDLSIDLLINDLKGE